MTFFEGLIGYTIHSLIHLLQVRKTVTHTAKMKFPVAFQHAAAVIKFFN